MSILDADINIPLGSVEDNSTSLRPWVNTRMSSYELRKAFGLPMYDEYRLERHSQYHEISHYTLINRARAKLMDAFKDIPIDMLSGGMIISTLAMADIKADAIMAYPYNRNVDYRNPERSHLIFELYRLNKRGRLKAFASIEVIDHFANASKWRCVYGMWSGYKKNAGEVSRAYHWGLPIYQAPRTHILQ